MSNPMKYIKDLEAAGFKRAQAEAPVQLVLDAIEGDLVTKSDFAIFQERLDNRFLKIDARFAQVEARFEQVDARFEQMESKIRESELRLTTRLGFIAVSCTTVGIAVLTWLIKLP